MKKQLLSVIALCGLLSANAQTFSGGTEYTVDYTGAVAANASCLLSSAPNSGGFAVAGGNLDATTPSSLTGAAPNGVFQLMSVSGTSTISPYATPAWFFLTETIGKTCPAMNADPSGATGVDMSQGDYKVAITISANMAANLDFFVGSAAAGTSQPASSTYNTGSGNYVTKTLAVTTGVQTIIIDYSAVAADKATFDAWAGRSMVNVVGYRSQTLGANFTINKIQFGLALATTSSILPSTVTYGPNPSSDNIQVNNIDVTALNLLDINGMVVRTSTESTINVAGLSTGLYFLQVNGYKPVKVMVK